MVDIILTLCPWNSENSLNTKAVGHVRQVSVIPNFGVELRLPVPIETQMFKFSKAAFSDHQVLGAKLFSFQFSNLIAIQIERLQTVGQLGKSEVGNRLQPVVGQVELLQRRRRQVVEGFRVDADEPIRGEIQLFQARESRQVAVAKHLKAIAG